MVVTIFYLTKTDAEGRSLRVRDIKDVAVENYTKITTIPNATDLGDVFRRMNVVDGSDIEIPLKLRVRSMSVGDVVVTTEPKGSGLPWASALLCCPIGWEPLDSEEGAKFIRAAVE